MATGSGKNKCVGAWWSFILGLSIIIATVSCALTFASDLYQVKNEIKSAFQWNITDTKAFKENIMARFDGMVQHLTENFDTINGVYFMESIKQEGENLLYYGENKETGAVIGNTSKELTFDKLPEGYHYALIFDGTTFWLKRDNDELIELSQGSQKNNDYQGYLGRYLGIAGEQNLPGISDCMVFFIVRENLVENPYGSSSLYNLSRQWLSIKVTVWVSLIILLLGFLLFINGLVRWRQKVEFDRRIARAFGKMWLELKLGLTVCIVILGGSYLSGIWWMEFPVNVITCVIVWLCIGLWLYFIVVDLALNKRQALVNNSIAALMRFYHCSEGKRPFQQMLSRRLRHFLGVMSLLWLLMLIFACRGFGNGDGLSLLVFFLLCIFTIITITRYVRRQQQWLRDMGKICDAIVQIKRGDMSSVLEMENDSDLYQAAKDLQTIQEGSKAAAGELLKSERLKIDLVTNISHDLKTPLTSIISYVDLLKREEGLPEYVNDYICILAQKSGRLKDLIDDLFSLAKATSNNLNVYQERLDFSRLVQQVLANMEEDIQRSGLQVKSNLDKSPLFIVSDGNKLCRVLENLIVNALKYSLAGSRIFIDLAQQGDLVIFTIKNTANYEMDFDEEEILQRFARGDKTRSSEGSGLGLAIAQSFTEACGGFFNIGIDGDQFRASVTFCKIPPEEIESDETNQQDADISISELTAETEALEQ